MLSCRNLLSLLTLITLVLITPSSAFPHDDGITHTHTKDASVIVEDVIPDAVEMDHKKVIRVSPLELPPAKEDPQKMIEESTLIKIQPIQSYKPNKRHYINSKNMRKSQPMDEHEKEHMEMVEKHMMLHSGKIAETSFMPPSLQEKFVKPKNLPKKKQLHFLYNQDDLSGGSLTKTMPVHVVPGAYPVYYVLAQTNGGFGKYPLKSFSTPEAFEKYLQKKKIDSGAQS